MTRTRVAAASTLVLALAWALLMLVTAYRQPPTLHVITAGTETTTTQADFEALVQTESVGGDLDETEEDLTEELLTPPSTTTTTVATSTTTAAATQTQPRPSTGTTSPPPPPSTTTTQPPAQTGGFDGGAESQFAASVNSLRTSSGLPALSRNGSLDSYARSWAKKLAEDGSLSHSNIGSLLPPWSAAAENVGTGGSASGVFDALASSSGHRSNMLGEYTDFGVGAYRDTEGRLWTAHVFTR